MDDAGEFFDAAAQTYDERLDANAPDGNDRTGWVGDDVAFYSDLARDAPGPALEVGVGTGRVYLELLRDGLDVDGIDVSERMLDRLRAKAAAEGLDPTVEVADVTDLDPDRQYGLVYVPARAFNHLASLTDQRAALERIRAALAPGGRLVLNSFVPSFEVVAGEYGEPHEETVTVDGEQRRIVRRTEIHDEVEQVARISLALYEPGDDEPVATRETPLSLIPKRQFELLFETAGFDDWTVYGGFDRKPLRDVTDEQVWIAER